MKKLLVISLFLITCLGTIASIALTREEKEQDENRQTAMLAEQSEAHFQTDHSSRHQETSRLDNNCEINNLKHGLSESNENTNRNQPTNQRIFIELNYIGNMYDVEYRQRMVLTDICPEDEFTWWNRYSIDEFLSFTNGDFILPAGTDIPENEIVISFGRRLKYLYFYSNDYIDSTCSYIAGGYRARPVFEKDYVHRSAYIYLIENIKLADSEDASGDWGRFLRGDIPFELPYSQ